MVRFECFHVTFVDSLLEFCHASLEFLNLAGINLFGSIEGGAHYLEDRYERTVHHRGIFGVGDKFSLIEECFEEFTQPSCAAFECRYMISEYFDFLRVINRIESAFCFL